MPFFYHFSVRRELQTADHANPSDANDHSGGE